MWGLVVKSDALWGQWSFTALSSRWDRKMIRNKAPQSFRFPWAPRSSHKWNFFESLTGLKGSRPKLPLLFRLPISVCELDWDIPSKNGLETRTQNQKTLLTQQPLELKLWFVIDGFQVSWPGSDSCKPQIILSMYMWEHWAGFTNRGGSEVSVETSES